MSAASVTQKLRSEAGELPDDIDRSTIERVLTQPEQESLAEALAADAVDAAPIIGDLLVIVRMERAKQQGIKYPEAPTAVENALSDIPAPLDTIGDIIVAQNTASYLDLYDDVDGLKTPDEFIEEAALNLGEKIAGFAGSDT